MSVNFNNNHKPSFGMAMRKPVTEEARKMLIAFTNMDKNPAAIKGYKQLEQEMAQFKRFDIEYVNKGQYIDQVNVIDKSSNTIVETFDGASHITGLEHFGVVHYPGKKLIAALFNPKKHLPNNFLMAADHVKTLEAEAIKAEQLKKMLDI